jgi:hypothetical protein
MEQRQKMWHGSGRAGRAGRACRAQNR